MQTTATIRMMLMLPAYVVSTTTEGRTLITVGLTDDCRLKNKTEENQSKGSVQGGVQTGSGTGEAH